MDGKRALGGRSRAAARRSLALGRPEPRAAADAAPVAAAGRHRPPRDVFARRLYDARAMDELLAYESDPELAADLDRSLKELEAEMDRLELASLLGGEYEGQRRRRSRPERLGHSPTNITMGSTATWRRASSATPLSSTKVVFGPQP
jgi:hypothetical protein